jgi:cytochrome b5
VPGDPPAKHVGGTDKVAAGPGKGSGGETGFGIALYGVLLVGGLLAFGAYQYLQTQESK